VCEYRTYDSVAPYTRTANESPDSPKEVIGNITTFNMGHILKQVLRKTDCIIT
jgi:hypothetical protein